MKQRRRARLGAAVKPQDSARQRCRGIRSALLLFLLSSSQLCAAPLSDPLPLEEALKLAEQHPAVAQAQAENARARADYATAQAQDDMQLSLSGNLRWVDPSDSTPDKSRDDHSAALTLNKTLYDFGRTRAATEAAELTRQAADAMLLDAQTQQRISVMARFFDVLLADMKFSVDDESMAIAYVNFDKRQERFEQGQVSGLALAKAEYFYQQTLQQRLRSEQAQRTSRARLANALNRPGELPSSLVKPTLPTWPDLPEAKDLQQQAEANNPRLNALRQQIQAAQKRLQAARAERWPVISGTAEANYWDREFGSRDKASAGIEIRVPLYQGGRVSAQISQAQADFQHAQAQLNATQLEVRQAVLDIWMEIKRLEAAKRSVDTYSHWQDLQLDHNRTMYDLEFDTDLGEAMIGQSEARLRKAQNQYALALAWEKLNALIGKEK